MLSAVVSSIANGGKNRRAREVPGRFLAMLAVSLIVAVTGVRPGRNLCRLLAVEARTAHDRFGLTHF